MANTGNFYVIYETKIVLGEFIGDYKSWPGVTSQRPRALPARVDTYITRDLL